MPYFFGIGLGFAITEGTLGAVFFAAHPGLLGADKQLGIRPAFTAKEHVRRDIVIIE